MYDLIKNYHAGQTRKKTGEPYVHHLLRVQKISCYYYVECEADETYSTDMLDDIRFISLGHDLIEDTECTYEEIKDEFGQFIADGILGLTNVYEKSDYPDLNRKERKRLEFERLSELPWHLRLIKACDRMDNLSMRYHEPSHWKKNYKPETIQLLDAIFPINGNRYRSLEKIIGRMIK